MTAASRTRCDVAGAALSWCNLRLRFRLPNDSDGCRTSRLGMFHQGRNAGGDAHPAGVPRKRVRSTGLSGGQECQRSAPKACAAGDPARVRGATPRGERSGVRGTRHAAQLHLRSARSGRRSVVGVGACGTQLPQHEPPQRPARGTRAACRRCVSAGSIHAVSATLTELAGVTPVGCIPEEGRGRRPRGVNRAGRRGARRTRAASGWC